MPFKCPDCEKIFQYESLFIHHLGAKRGCKKKIYSTEDVKFNSIGNHYTKALEIIEQLEENFDKNVYRKCDFHVCYVRAAVRQKKYSNLDDDAKTDYNNLVERYDQLTKDHWKELFSHKKKKSELNTNEEDNIKLDEQQEDDVSSNDEESGYRSEE